jgi:hypothetical protein
MGRDAHDLFSHELAASAERQIVLTEMNTVSVASQRDIDAIVNNESAVMRSSDCARLLCQLEKISGRQRFDSQL